MSKISKLFVPMIFILVVFACCSFLTACEEENAPVIYTVEFYAPSATNLSKENPKFFSKVTSIEINKGECIGGNAPTQSFVSSLNYTFVGWYTEKEYINPWNLYKDEVQTNMTLYAKYVRK